MAKRTHHSSGVSAALGAVLALLPSVALAQATEPEPPEIRPHPIVSLTFDDSHESHAWAAEVLSQMGMVGTFYVNSERIGGGGYLRAQELRSMEALGHEIGGHTLNHDELANLSESQQFREICDDRDALLSLGLSIRSLAYPFNSYSPSTFRIAESCGYASARAAAGISAPGDCRNCPKAESLPPPEPFRLQTFPSYQRKMGLETLLAAIEEASEDGWLIFVFHDICDGSCSTYDIRRADFLGLLDWMKLQRVRTHTVSEMVLGEEPAPGPCIDIDEDGVCRELDNCPATANADQADSDGDGIGDACDFCPFDPANDPDGDGVCDDVDNCPGLANPAQADSDGDDIGDICDACLSDPENDADGDGLCGDVDNCPGLSNPDQADWDGDGVGDLCDPCPLSAENDADGDGLCSYVDNCPMLANPDQADSDGDGIGDACDPCPLDGENDADGDGICGDVDNCPRVANPNQTDADANSIGDTCEEQKAALGKGAGHPLVGSDVGCSGTGSSVPSSLLGALVAIYALRRRVAKAAAAAPHSGDA